MAGRAFPLTRSVRRSRAGCNVTAFWAIAVASPWLTRCCSACIQSCAGLPGQPARVIVAVPHPLQRSPAARPRAGIPASVRAAGQRPPGGRGGPVKRPGVAAWPGCIASVPLQEACAAWAPWVSSWVRTAVSACAASVWRACSCCAAWRACCTCSCTCSKAQRVSANVCSALSARWRSLSSSSCRMSSCWCSSARSSVERTCVC